MFKVLGGLDVVLGFLDEEFLVSFDESEEFVVNNDVVMERSCFSIGIFLNIILINLFGFELGCNIFLRLKEKLLN